MKVKTSVTITDTLLADMDKACGGAGQRSAFIESAIRARLETIKRQQRDTKDLGILNNQAIELSAEADEVLAWQTAL